MNQNKISKETAILFAFFIVGILTIFGAPIWISIIIVFILAISWALYSRKISTPATSAPTPAASTAAPATQIPVWKRINWTVVGATAIIAVVIFLLYGPMLGYITFNPYGDGFVSKSQIFSYKAEGNITGESGGPSWKSFTAGKGNISGELYLPDKVETGDCVKINFYADKKGGKIKIIFRPYEGSPSYRDGAEIEIREEKNTANLCYMASAEKTKAQAQAVVLFDIPENVTATFIKE